MKFLEDPMQTMGVGSYHHRVGRTYLGLTGIRWVKAISQMTSAGHFLAGITIGLFFST